MGISDISKKIKNNIKSEAVNAKRVVSCKKVLFTMYVRCRVMGSLLSLFWLANMVSGNNQHVRTVSGAEILSIINNAFEK